MAFDVGGFRVAHGVPDVPQTGVVHYSAPATPTPQRSTPPPSPSSTPAPTPSAAPAATAVPTPPPPPTREVLGFAPYWTLDTWQQWRMQDLSTIAYFGVTLDANGNTVGDEMWPTWQSQQLTDMVNAAHANHVRVLVTIVCFDDGDINSMVNDPGHMATAVQTASDLMRMRGLDGVMVDFEGSYDPQYAGISVGMTQFAAALRAKVKSYRADAEVDMATYSSAADGTGGGIVDLHGLAPSVDAFFLMGYDMATVDSPGRASANAPLQLGQYNDATAVQQYVAAVGANKVILGVPYYGYKWSVTTTDANATTLSDPESVTYSQMLDDESCALNLGLHDQQTATPWVTWYSPPTSDPCGGNLNTWREAYVETPTSLGAKYNLVNSAGLRGTGMWALGFDAGHGELWDALQSHVTAAH